MRALDLPAMSTAALRAATFFLAFGSGIIPFVFNLELYLLAVATFTDASALAIVGLATAGQTIAKFLVYFVPELFR